MFKRGGGTLKRIIIIQYSLVITLKKHLFQNKVEQGAFLFSKVLESPEELRLEAVDLYCVPPDGWEVQEKYFLEMKNDERARIMKIARDGDFAIVDCHSHPRQGKLVCFSPSDCKGIEEFATYARWKLDRRPYAAMIWGEASIDGILWHGDFTKPHFIDEIQIIGKKPTVLLPRNIWYLKPAIKSYGYGKRSIQ